MESITSVVRLIHILSAVFWGGALFTLNFFLFPSIKSLGPEGGKFMQQFSKTNSFPQVMTIAGAVTILSGIYVFWQFSAGFSSEFMGSKMGILFSIGGLSGLIAFFQGILVNRPAIMRIGKIGEEIAKSGAPPAAEQTQEIGKLRNRIFNSTKLITVYIVIAVTLMSLARYI